MQLRNHNIMRHVIRHQRTIIHTRDVYDVNCLESENQRHDRFVNLKLQCVTRRTFLLSLDGGKVRNYLNMLLPLQVMRFNFQFQFHLKQVYFYYTYMIIIIFFHFIYTSLCLPIFDRFAKIRQTVYPKIKATSLGKKDFMSQFKTFPLKAKS